MGIGSVVSRKNIGVPIYRTYKDGDSYALDEWLYDPAIKKIFKANTVGVQAGTFEDNSALWTEIGSFGLFSATSTQFKANIVGGSALNAAAATATIPGLLPDAANFGTGIGSAANEKLSLIANSKELMRLDGVGGNTQITTLGNMTIGNAPGAATPNKLTVFGGIGPSVGGRATGQLKIMTNLSGVNDTAIMTGHSSFNGDTQQWYLGGVSSSNQHIAFINRSNAEFQLWTNNAVGLTQTGDKAYIFKNADNSLNISKDGMFTFNGTKHGLRLPNHTTTTRLALTHANGLIIWDDTLDTLMLSVNGLWKNMTPPVTRVVFSGTTGTNEGDTVSVTHLLGLADIKDVRSITAVVWTPTDQGIIPGFTSNSGFQYDVWIDAGNIHLKLHNTNSETIVSSPYTVVIEHV